jgi:hypothetical protein
MRGAIHSSHGGQKRIRTLKSRIKTAGGGGTSKSGLPDFDIVNTHLGNSRDGCAVLDFKVRMRPGQSCDEWEGVTGVA